MIEINEIKYDPRAFARLTLLRRNVFIIYGDGDMRKAAQQFIRLIRKESIDWINHFPIILAQYSVNPDYFKYWKEEIASGLSPECYGIKNLEVRVFKFCITDDFIRQLRNLPRNRVNVCIYTKDLKKTWELVPIINPNNFFINYEDNEFLGVVFPAKYFK